METAFLAVILLTMAWLALRRPASLALPILGVAAFLVHPEAVAVYPIYVLLGIGPFIGRWALFAREPLAENMDLFPSTPRGGGVQGGQSQTNFRSVPRRTKIGTVPAVIIGTVPARRFIIGLSILVLLTGAVTVARYVYFHDVLPNTFHSKPGGVLQALENSSAFLLGRNTNIPYWLPGWLLLPMLWFGARSAGRTAPAAARMLAAIAVTGIAMAIYSKPDWTATARYFAPYLPATVLLFWAGVADVIRRLPREQVRETVRRTMLVGLATTQFAMAVFDDAAQAQMIDWFPGYVMTANHLVPPAIWVRSHLPADAVIATRRIGVLSYYSGHPIFDYAYGLPDRNVARRVAERGGWFDLPTDFALADLWRARAPDYLLEDSAIIDAICKSEGGTPQRFSIHGLKYRVIRRFPIGCVSEWVLSERIDRQPKVESVRAGYSAIAKVHQ
jgi:hypothetical protein